MSSRRLMQQISDGNMSTTSDICPPSASFFGMMGCTAALVFSNLGAAYGTAKSGVGVAAMGVLKPDLIMRSILPVVLAGILGIYGLIIAVLIGGKVTGPPADDTQEGYSLFQGYGHLAAGLSVGLSGLAAGMCIGIVGDAGVRGSARQPKLFVAMILILIFAEALALYGLIVGLVLSNAASGADVSCWPSK